MSYRVVTGRYETEIISLVNSAYEEGWVVYGGVSVAISPGGTIFAQAMVRNVEDVMEKNIDKPV